MTSASVWAGNAQNAQNRIVNYNQCPKCGARDLKTITKDQSIAENQQKNNNSSSADQLLKYKELLDNGAISEEEYKALKQKLLNI